MNKDFTIYCPSIRLGFVEEIRRRLPHYKVRHFDGSKYLSCAKMTNDLIVDCPTETVVIIHDKIRPVESEIPEMLNLLDKGYGMVWLWPFGFGCFKKDIIRKVGFYDERFSDGQYEDADYIRRCREADIALYMLHKSERITIGTLWAATESQKFYEQKWGPDGSWNRLLSEESPKYNLGPYQGTRFLTWNATVVDAHPPATSEQNYQYRRALGLE